ncbi:MAG: site-specific integrase [Clostridia bacterium]|nr:site-specific integrase [Clostridia bacterium]
MKYNQWLNQWLEYYIRPSTKDRTYNKYARIVYNHISPTLGDMDMQELTALELQKFSVDLLNKGMAPNTVNGIISIVKCSLRRAESLGIVDKQYADAITRPKTKEKDVESLSRDEQRKIEQYISDNKEDNRFGIILCMYTGLRVGELLALKWRDVDFIKSILTVNKSCHDSWKDGEYVKVIDTPKTDSSIRKIPIPKQLISKLKELKKKAKGEYVIIGKTQYGAQVRSYQRSFENLLNLLDIPHKGIHCLRHTFATRALEVGMDVKTLSEILGHKSPTVTLKRYAHSMIEHKAEMMNRVGKILL